MVKVKLEELTVHGYRSWLIIGCELNQLRCLVEDDQSNLTSTKHESHSQYSTCMNPSKPLKRDRESRAEREETGVTTVGTSLASEEEDSE